MAISHITGGAFQDAQGTVLVSARLVLRLSADALITGVGQLAPKEVQFVTDASGNVDGDIWFNSQLSPSGTVYEATLFDSSGARVWGPENWSLTGSSPINVNTITPSSNGVSYSGAILTDPPGNQTINSGSLTVPSLATVSTLASGTTIAVGTSATVGTTLVVGTSAASPIFKSGQSNLAGAGVVRLTNTEAVKWRNNANSADFGIAGNSSDRTVLDAPGGLLLTGATTPDIFFGGTTASFPRLKRSSARLQVRAADDSQYNPLDTGDLFIHGSVTTPIGTSPLTPGIPLIISTTGTSTGNSAAISSTPIWTATQTNMVRLSYYLEITTAGNAVNLTGTFGWTDDASQTHSLTTANIACNTLGANSSSALGLGTIIMYVKSGTDVTLATGLSGAIGTGRYSVILRLEYLG